MHIITFLFFLSTCSIVDFLPVGFSCIKGIEQKVLKERENFLSYSRQELEQIYIKGATTSPLHQTVFFPCKVKRERRGGEGGREGEKERERGYTSHSNFTHSLTLSGAKASIPKECQTGSNHYRYQSSRHCTR